MLTYGGTEVQGVTYNGQAVGVVTYNGTTVWAAAKDVSLSVTAAYTSDDLGNYGHLKIEVPSIQHLFNEVRIIPVLVGRTEPQKITEIISEYYDNKDFGFIISSDLSHFLDTLDMF